MDAPKIYIAVSEGYFGSYRCPKCKESFLVKGFLDKKAAQEYVDEFFERIKDCKCLEAFVIDETGAICKP